jgi:hypothetical protein
VPPVGPEPTVTSVTARLAPATAADPAAAAAAPAAASPPVAPSDPDPAVAPSDPRRSRPWRGGERRRRRTAIAAAAAVVALGVIVGIVVIVGNVGNGGEPAAVPFHPYVSGTGPAAPAGPAGAATIKPLTITAAPGDAFADRLHRQVLFLAEGDVTELVGTDGTVLRRLEYPAAPSADPVALNATTVVYLSGGHAYAFDTTLETGPVFLGAAQAVFSAGPGAVILVARSGSRQTITMVNGDLTAEPSYGIPGSFRVVAGSAAGLLVETRAQTLALLSPGDVATKAVTGPISRLVAFSGHEVAWTSQAGCQLVLTSDCPLHLTNVRTGADRLVDVPGAVGFAGIGAFSPDGRALAVYELSGRPQQFSGLDLVVVPMATGAALHIATLLDAGAVTPTVSWSPTGEWLFFGGSDSFDTVDIAPPGPTGRTALGSTAASDIPVPLPVTVRCCMVAF